MLTTHVTYKRKNRESWNCSFIGETLIDQLEGLQQWIERHRAYGFTVELEQGILGGYKAIIDTHGKAGWEKPQLKLVVNKGRLTK